jgi:hypothetical protein
MAALRLLSLGAGVQSSVVALMALDGDIPPIDAAIFADTGAEPEAVYRHLDWLAARFERDAVPLYRVGDAALEADVLDSWAGRKINRARPSPPLFVDSEGGGMIRRQCTLSYKVRPIMRKVRELAGIAQGGGRQPKDHRVTQLLGISLDEVGRMRDADRPWLRNEYPLVDARMTRWDCLRWTAARGYPEPPRSACVFCPFHSDDEWRRLRDHDPAGWARAVAFDAGIRDGRKVAIRYPLYVHNSMVPLDEVDLSTPEDHGQQSLFGSECHGVCGL